jgi:hypothetical protein
VRNNCFPGAGSLIGGHGVGHVDEIEESESESAAVAVTRWVTTELAVTYVMA